MITISAEISVNSKLSIISETPNTTTSSPVPTTSKTKAKNAFLLGVGKLGDGSKMYSKLPYFIGSVISDNDGVFETPYVFQISNIQTETLAIYFDEENGVFPTRMDVDGYNVNVDAPVVNVNLTESEDHIVTIYSINRAKYPLVVCGFFSGENRVLNYRSLKSVEADIFERGDYQNPDYGIISNVGSISFNDFDRKFLYYLQNKDVFDFGNIFIYLNDTISKRSEQIAEFIPDYWQYDNNNRSVTVSLKDDLEEWQDIFVSGINYNASVFEPKTAKYFYEFLHEKTPQKYRMLSFEELDQYTKKVLEGTTIMYPFLEDDDLWSQWDKLCKAFLLHIFKRSDGRTVCFYNLGG